MLQAACIALALGAALAPIPPEIVERWFSTGVYPRIQHLLTPVSNVVPFAWLDLVIAVGATTLVVALVRGVRAAWRERKPSILLRTLGRIAGAAAVAYLAFLVLWGFNYRRVPMEQRLVLERDAPTTEVVSGLGLQAVERLNALHADAHAAGWVEDPRQDASLVKAFGGVQRSLSDARPAAPGRLKRSALGTYFRWSGVDGMVNPYGLEVLANPDLLPFERPFVAAHEWSHLAGYADESEANFVGWLSCVRADVSAQYSGWLYLCWQVNGELGPEQRARLGAALAAGPRRDIEAIVDRLRRGQFPMLRTASWLVYDQYLKANRVEEGVRSYGAVVNLILRARFDDRWTPVRRTEPAKP